MVGLPWRVTRKLGAQQEKGLPKRDGKGPESSCWLGTAARSEALLPLMGSSATESPLYVPHPTPSFLFSPLHFMPAPICRNLPQQEFEDSICPIAQMF